jgi:putative hemolysin
MDENTNHQSLARPSFFTPMHFVIIGIIGILMLAIGVFVGMMVKNESAPPIVAKHSTAQVQTVSNTQPLQTMAPTGSDTGNMGLPNPASQNCIAQGGTLQIKTLPNGAQYGLCNFEDAYACEEWALYRGQCPPNGVKTTGFTTEAQRYCAWLGGQTLAVKDATCTLPSGKVCPDEALYNGTCSLN